MKGLAVKSMVISLALIFNGNANAQVTPHALPAFYSQISPLSTANQAVMKQYSWHPECPVPLAELASVQVSYVDFDKNPHIGILVVNKKVASEVVAIFKQLYLHQFPIQSMVPIDVYQGDDNISLSANNTAAFNCRDIVNSPGKFSKHAYGLAIDINPVQNPYVKGDQVLPPSGRAYLNRDHVVFGMITDKGIVVQKFREAGWTWGGSWNDRKDYQHFQKMLPEYEATPTRPLPSNE